MKIDELQSIGIRIDDFLSSGNKEDLEECIKILEDNDNNIKDKSLLYYFLGNAYSNLGKIDDSIFNFKKAYDNFDFYALRYERKLQILINLGNAYSTCKAYVRAEEIFKVATHLLPKSSHNSMLTIARVHNLFFYLDSIYDEGHKEELIIYICKILEKETKNYINLEKHAKPYLESLLQWRKEKLKYFKKNNIPLVVKSKKEDLEKVKKEVNGYVDFCLKNVLFINPLNDFTTKPLKNGFFIYKDILSMPNYTVKLIKNDTLFPSLSAYLEEIKFDYCSLRQLFYLTSKNLIKEFEERNIKINTFDSNLYSIKIGRIKLIYKELYSILDKIASFLLEFYFIYYYKNTNKQSSNHKELRRIISFRKLFGELQEKEKKEIKNLNEFTKKNFLGLLLIYKELFEDKLDTFKYNYLRNKLEHGYVRVVKCSDYIKPQSNQDFVDSKITSEELEEKTFCLLKKIRESIIYTILGITKLCEEKNMEKEDVLVELIPTIYKN